MTNVKRELLRLLPRQGLVQVRGLQQVPHKGDERGRGVRGDKEAEVEGGTFLPFHKGLRKQATQRVQVCNLNPSIRNSSIRLYGLFEPSAQSLFARPRACSFNSGTLVRVQVCNLNPLFVTDIRSIGDSISAKTFCALPGFFRHGASLRPSLPRACLPERASRVYPPPARASLPP